MIHSQNMDKHLYNALYAAQQPNYQHFFSNIFFIYSLWRPVLSVYTLMLRYTHSHIHLNSTKKSNFYFPPWLLFIEFQRKAHYYIVWRMGFVGVVAVAVVVDI